ncbi:MAG: hypothetical protein EA360_07240 [Balneolaceae bacterium]|nr:MAG: hypothetical protein EA360_07240 [Balneolaceae bacterium]
MPNIFVGGTLNSSRFANRLRYYIRFRLNLLQNSWFFKSAINRWLCKPFLKNLNLPESTTTRSE